MTDHADNRWSRQMIAADVYDCYSLRAAEKTGYNAAYLSMDAVAECVCGLKKTCRMSSEEFLWAAKRVISFSNLPIIAEIRNGFGVTAESAARAAGRLAKAGAAAVWIDDSVFQDRDSRIAGSRWERRIDRVCSAVKDYSCRLICTVQLEGLAFAEACEKCRQAARMGAGLTGIAGLKNLEDAGKFSEFVNGPKVWIGTDRGTVSAEELENLGYRLILDCHSVKGALEGMRLFGRRTQTDRHTVFHDQHDFDGMLPSRSHYDLFEFYKIWIPLEQHFLKEASEIGKITE